MNVKTSSYWNFQFNIKLGVAAGGSVEFDGSVAPPNVEIDAGLFHIALPARFHGIFQPDLCGIAALDVHVANTDANMEAAAGYELAGVGVRLFITPVAGRAKRHQEETQQKSPVELRSLNYGSLRHGAPLWAHPRHLLVRNESTVGSGRIEEDQLESDVDFRLQPA